MSEILSIYEIADLNKNTITAKDNFSFIVNRQQKVDIRY